MQGQAQSAAGASSSQLALATLTGQDTGSADTDRAHLEANMASALTLQSPQEYQRWLLTYVRYLTRSKSCPSVNKAESHMTLTGSQPAVQLLSREWLLLAVVLELLRASEVHFVRYLRAAALKLEQ